MRLREIQWILNAAIPDLTLQTSNQRGAKDTLTYVTVSNVNKTRTSLELLASVDLFRDLAVEALESTVFTPHQDAVDVLLTDGNRTETIIQTLRQQVTQLSAILEQVLPEERADSFSIHWPLTHPLTLKELSKEIKDVQEIFEQPLRRFANTEMRLAGVDSGSMVMEFATTVGQALDAMMPALKAVASIVTAAYALQVMREKSRQEVEKTKQMVFKTESERLETVQQEESVAQRKQEAYLRGASTDICVQFEGGSVENFEVVVSRSVKKMSDKLDVGVKVILSSNAPKSVVTEAPPQMLPPKGAIKPTSDPPLPEPPKQLTDGSEDPEEEEGPSQG